jgi:hypothetical protein
LNGGDGWLEVVMIESVGTILMEFECYKMVKDGYDCSDDDFGV